MTLTSDTSHTPDCSLEFPRIPQAPSHSQKQPEFSLSAESHAWPEQLQSYCLGTESTASHQVLKPTHIGQSAQVSPVSPTHSILTVPTPGPAFEDESIWHSPIAPEIRQLPLPHDSWRDVFSQDEDVIAEMESGWTTLQFGARSYCHMEPMYCRPDRGQRDITRGG